MQRIGARVAQNFTVDQALRAAMVDQPAHFSSIRLAQAILNVLTQSQQIRVLEQVGWTVCPGPAIAAAPAHHSV